MSGIKIRETDRGFYIDLGPDYKTKLNDIHSINGAKYYGPEKGWFVPYHREREVEMLKKKYGIMTDPVLEMPEQLGEVPDLPELTIDLPLLMEPRSYQRTGIAKGIEWKKFLNADEMGLGKTLQAIATMVALECTCILVICPNTLKPNWGKEWMQVAGWKSMELTDKNRSSWQTYHKVGMIHVFIVNYSSLKKYFVAPGWVKPKGKFKLSDIPFKDCINLFDGVIVDESKECKEGKTLQSRLTRGICAGKKSVILLNGTPVINKPRDLAAQLLIIGRLKDVVAHIPDSTDPKTGKMKDPTGYTRFLNRYCEGGTGKANLKELNYRLKMICMFRREKREVAKDLPDIMRQIVLCELTNQEEYDKAEEDFVNYLKTIKGCTDEEVETKLRGQMMVKMGVLLNITGRGKLEAAQEYIKDVVDGGKKIVIFYHLVEVLRELKKMFPNSASIVGEDEHGRNQKPAERQANIERFQTDPNCMEITCSNTAGGVGVTLTAASDLLIIQLPWTDAIIDQIIARIHRIGQDEACTAGIMIAKGTIDEYVYNKIILPKRDMHRTVTGSTDTSQDGVVDVDDMLKFFSSDRQKDAA